MILTPLEQFQITVLVPCRLYFLDLSFTNLLFINLIILFLYIMLVNVFSKNGKFNYIPNIWQALIEKLNKTVALLLYDNINEKGEKYLPFIYVVLLFIVSVNLIGLIPYSFTVTSHLIVTLTMSFAIFIGVNVICIEINRENILSLFLPSNTFFGLALLLVPIEFISYIFKPISLGVRLFANLMAGHTLLKVIIGFSWSILFLENIIYILHLIPLSVIVLLFGLELGVALIQAYVFTILTCIYLNDSIHLH